MNFFEGYTKQEVEKEKLVCEIKGMVQHTTYREYKDIASNKVLLNCTITTHEITIENYMFGTDLAGVRGKTVIKKLSRVYTE